MSDTQDVNTEVDAQDADATTNDQSVDTNEQDSQVSAFESLPKQTQDEIKALRRENAKHRKALKEREDAEKTELQRLEDANGELTQKYADLESKYRNTIAESAFIDAATKEKARTPRTLFRAYKSELEFDEYGNVTNLAAVIEKARSDEPDAFQPTSGKLDGGTTGTVVSDPKAKMNDLFRTLAESKN